MPEVLRIMDSEKPGDYIVIDAGLYDPQAHVLFDGTTAIEAEAEPEEEIDDTHMAGETESIPTYHPRGPGRPKKVR